MINRFVVVATIVVLAVGALVVPIQSQDSNEVGLFMRAKLNHSQKILEGLTVEDFDQIAKNAQQLALLSQAANWQVLQTEEYLQHSIEFRRSADALKKAAKKGNLDGATLAYVDMTMKCVRCHKYVRGVRMAALPQKTEDASLARTSK